MKTLRKKDTQYKIKEILHSGSCDVRGTKRTDGRYPLRIGRIVDLDVTKIIGDAPMIINYVGHTDGTSLKGMVLYTSHVIHITVKVTEVTVETENSIYVFERMWKNGELL